VIAGRHRPRATSVWFPWVRDPYGDAYDILSVEFAAQDRGDPGFYLWHHHGGHHIVWLRLLTALDVRLFNGQSYIFLAAALPALIATAAMLSREIWRGVADRRLAVPLAAVAPLALLTSLNAFDVSAPLNTPYVFTLLFAVPAFILAERGAGGFGALIGLLALAAGSAMGNSVGLATFAVVMVAVARRPDRGRLVWFWAAAPFVVAVFVGSAAMFTREAAATEHLALAERALRSGRYFFSFAGLPWSASSDKALTGGWRAAVAGPLLGLVLASLGLWLAARPPKGTAPADRLDRLCCSLILFSIAAAGMAALGRANATAAFQVPVRYSLILAPLHIGLVVLVVTRNAERIRRASGALAPACAAILVLALTQQILGRHIIIGYCSHIREVVAAFNAGQRTAEMPQYVYPDLSRAEMLTAEMRKRGLYR